MGLDCPDIHQIIHCGSPSDCEQYVQEIGRAGWDGNASKAILMYKPNHHTTYAIKEYVRNKVSCRRQLLYKDFLAYNHEPQSFNCNCCDNCALSCKCIQCKN